MKVLFLDIDGVLNSTQTFLERMGDYERQDYPQPILVERLNKIIDETDAEIVISSCWRIHGKEELQKIFTECGIKKKILDFTPKLFNSKRGIEILSWLINTDYGKKTDNIAILDDDSDMGVLSNFLIKTDRRFGLSEKNAQTVINSLKYLSSWKD